MKQPFVLFTLLLASSAVIGQGKGGKAPVPPAKEEIPATPFAATIDLPARFRNIGPFRGGRSVAATGVVGNPLLYYMGTTGGGLWKTTDAGLNWHNISDGFFSTGSIGAIAVSESDPNVIYVGAGEHAPRGVMTSYGDGMYLSTDAGKTWKHAGLEQTRHISGIVVHPSNPDIVYVAAQGALYGPNEERGVFRSVDGGKTWKKILYYDAQTGCSDISMDMHNPRILYAALWDHGRKPWEIRSGGEGSGLYKSVDGGESWEKLQKGLPEKMGKMGIKVCRSNPEKVYALIESDTYEERGGLFVSSDAGKNWSRISGDHRLTQRAWYYIELFPDPLNENIVYVFNSPGLKSADGGKTWSTLSGTHGDYHHLWINPNNGQNMIVANDGGAAISFNGGQTWSSQNNQPTAQFYRVNADKLFPYRVYGGQQDNSSVVIASRNTSGYTISEKDWGSSGGGESAFIAFDPNDPRYVAGGSYQGTIEILDTKSNEGKPVMVAPIQYQSLAPKDMKFRFNWNAPIIYSQHEPNTFYHAGNRLFRTTDFGKTWDIVSPDLTRHDTTKMNTSGTPFTNEGAGGENYCTISYVAESPHRKGVLWTGSDDGLVHRTDDGGKNWQNVTPAALQECLINSIEFSPHDPNTIYLATTRYKFNDLTPGMYKTTDNGKTWISMNKGIPVGAYTRVVREDVSRKDLLFAGTETGLYLSYDGGKNWQQQQLGLPITPITDLKVHEGDLIASTMGRSFWIFDDLPLLRQLPESQTAGAVLFIPENQYRVSGMSILDQPNSANESGSLPLQASAGINPSSGIVFYYQLPEMPTLAAPLQLDIYNDKNKCIRTFSSQADSGFVRFPGGAPEAPVLPVKRGINRFVWDMRHPIIPGVPTVFIEGSYLGHKAPPGNYRAVLKVGDKKLEVSFSILADPRLPYSGEEYAQQDSFLTDLEESLKDIHLSILHMRKVKSQLELLIPLLKEQPQKAAVKTAAEKLFTKMKAWEDELVQNKAQSNDDIINYINKLSADYIFLKGEADASIPYVTKSQREQLAILKATWRVHKQTQQQMLQEDIPALNRSFQEKGMGTLVLPAGLQ